MGEHEMGEREMVQQAAIRAQTAGIPEETAAWVRGTEEQQAAAETVLFVEDEAFVREVTGEVLRSAGYRVLTAKDATEATRAYEAHRGAVDLLLTDVVLPGESGRGLAGRLRRGNPRLKVLLMTGYAEQIGRCEVGVEECLAKPFSVGSLLRKVRQALNRGGLRMGEEDPVRRACGTA